MKHVSFPTPLSLLRVLRKIGKTLPIFTPSSAKEATAKSAYLFLQFTLAINANRFKLFVDNSDERNVQKFDSHLVDIIKNKINPCIKTTKEFLSDQIDLVFLKERDHKADIMQSLYEGGFFKLFALQLFKLDTYDKMSPI